MTRLPKIKNPKVFAAKSKTWHPGLRYIRYPRSGSEWFTTVNYLKSTVIFTKVVPRAVREVSYDLISYGYPVVILGALYFSFR